jgi:hypothetical protein
LLTIKVALHKAAHAGRVPRETALFKRSVRTGAAVREAGVIIARQRGLPTKAGGGVPTPERDKVRLAEGELLRRHGFGVRGRELIHRNVVGPAAGVGAGRVLFPREGDCIRIDRRASQPCISVSDILVERSRTVSSALIVVLLWEAKGEVGGSGAGDEGGWFGLSELVFLEEHICFLARVTNPLPRLAILVRQRHCLLGCSHFLPFGDCGCLRLSDRVD